MTQDDKTAREISSDAVIVYTTWPDADTATAAAEALVGQGLAACANILPAMTSVFIWEGKLRREQETAMILKTRKELADRLVAETRRHHPYDTPAILVLEVSGGFQPFLAWIQQQTIDPCGTGASGARHVAK